MGKAISLRLPDTLSDELEKLSVQLERPKSYIMKKALEEYLAEYSDYLIALHRLNDKNDPVISSHEMRSKLGL